MSNKQRKETVKMNREKIGMKTIREWYKKTYGKLEDGDIADGYDICDIIWKFEKDRKDLQTK